MQSAEHMDKLESQTRFAIVGSILVSLALLALTLAITGTQ